MKVLLRLYPAWWRARYGQEFGALLEEHPLTLGRLINIVLAALDARIHGRQLRSDAGVSLTPRHSTAKRVGGGGAVVISAVLVIFLLAQSSADHVRPRMQTAAPTVSQPVRAQPIVVSGSWNEVLVSTAVPHSKSNGNRVVSSVYPQKVPAERFSAYPAVTPHAP